MSSLFTSGGVDNFNTTGSVPAESPFTHTGAHLNERAAINAVETALRGIYDGVCILSYDKTGTTNAGPVLQSAIDDGRWRTIVIPKGIFYANSAVFYDQQDGNDTLCLLCYGCVFKAGTGLPTVVEWDSFMSGKSRLTGTKWFLFPNTLRAALSGGAVTANGNYVPGTATYPTTRIGVSPHLVVKGGTFDASNITNYNAGFCFGNRGGAADIQEMHQESARTLLSWWDYVDGNKMMNCSAWAATVISATNDAAPFYQITSGDGVYIQGIKTDNYHRAARLFSCNGAYINSIVGGGVSLETCHGIVGDANHTEVAQNIGTVPRNVWEITDSHVTIRGSFDYLTEGLATNGDIYVNDSGSEGAHSEIVLEHCLFRHWFSGSQSDPGPGYAMYLKNMNDATEIAVHECWNALSPVGTFALTYGKTGMTIGGDGTQEPTLAAAYAKSLDLIGSGTFQIVKSYNGVAPTGQNIAMNIEFTAIGSHSGIYRGRPHFMPTFFDAETITGVAGSLTASTSYAYCAAVGNTLPDGTFQSTARTAEWLETSSSSGTVTFEMRIPYGAHGCTLRFWRKTGTGVQASPDHYVDIPIGSSSGRFMDTGVYINAVPWKTTSIPATPTADATVTSLWVNGTQVTIP